MTPEEQEERARRWDELDLNRIEDREEAKRLLDEMEREMDAGVASLPPADLDDYALEIWELLKETKAQLVRMTDALPIIPETVARDVFVQDLEELWLRQEVEEARDRMRPYRDRGERPPDDLHEIYLDARDRYEEYMASPSRPFDVQDTVFITEPLKEVPAVDPEEIRLQAAYLTELHRLAEFYERSATVDDAREHLEDSADESDELHKRVRDAADRLNEHKRRKRSL
jgi:hypothetical protein